MIPLSNDTKSPNAFLAFDHRRSFERLLLKSSIPIEEHYSRIVNIKDTIFAGVEKVLEDEPRLTDGLAILIDEQYAATLTRRAHQLGLQVALSVERNEAPILTLEYGKNWQSHLMSLQPDFTKVLIRWFVDDQINRDALRLLTEVSDWIQSQGIGLLLEVIPELNQSHLLVDGIGAMIDRGIYPRYWKFPAPNSKAEASEIVNTTRKAPGPPSGILLLGGARTPAQAREAISSFLTVSGITGWAIGRAIWSEAIENMISGESSEIESRDLIATELIAFLRLFEQFKSS